jgi:hypothetical protein
MLALRREACIFGMAQDSVWIAGRCFGCHDTLFDSTNNGREARHWRYRSEQMIKVNALGEFTF